MEEIESNKKKIVGDIPEIVDPKSCLGVIDDGSKTKLVIDDGSKTKLPGTEKKKTDTISSDTKIHSMKNVTIRRPFDKISSYELVYRKNHSCISFGLGWKIINLNESKYLLTTPYMSLPVDRPFFYMSPSEFRMLPIAAYIKEVKCKVIMRSPQRTYETNSSISTFNDHIKIGYKQGLNLCTRSIDKKMEFAEGSDTMIPVGTKDLTIVEDEILVKCMYGGTYIKPVKATKTNLPSTSKKKKDSYEFEGFEFVPRSFLNLPFVCNRYLTLIYDAKENKAKIGFPQMNKLVHGKVVNYFVDKTILDYSYTPEIGYVTQPPEMLINGYWGENPKELDIINMNGNITSRRMTINTNDGTVSANQIKLVDVKETQWKNLCKRYNEKMYCCPIEKSQYISMGLDKNSDGRVQPSVHVGLYSLPQITTTDGNIPEKFSDISVQWDVETECVIAFGYSTMGLTNFPHGNIVNAEDGLYMAEYENTSENLYYQTEYSTIHNAHIAKFE